MQAIRQLRGRRQHVHDVQRMNQKPVWMKLPILLEGAEETGAGGVPRVAEDSRGEWVAVQPALEEPQHEWEEDGVRLLEDRQNGVQLTSTFPREFTKNGRPALLRMMGSWAVGGTATMSARRFMYSGVSPSRS